MAEQVPQAHGPPNLAGGSAAAPRDSAVASSSQAGGSAGEKPPPQGQSPRARLSLPDDEAVDSHWLADKIKAKEAGEAAKRYWLARLYDGVTEPGKVNRAAWESLLQFQVQQAGQIAELTAQASNLEKQIKRTKRDVAHVRRGFDMKNAHIQRMENATAQEAEASWLRLLSDMRERNGALKLEVEDLERKDRLKMV